MAVRAWAVHGFILLSWPQPRKHALGTLQIKHITSIDNVCMVFLFPLLRGGEVTHTPFPTSILEVYHKTKEF